MEPWGIQSPDRAMGEEESRRDSGRDNHRILLTRRLRPTLASSYISPNHELTIVFCYPSSLRSIHAAVQILDTAIMNFDRGVPTSASRRHCQTLRRRRTCSGFVFWFFFPVQSFAIWVKWQVHDDYTSKLTHKQTTTGLGFSIATWLLERNHWDYRFALFKFTQLF